MDIDELVTRVFVVLGIASYALGIVMIALQDAFSFVGPEVVIGVGVVGLVMGGLVFRYRLNGDITEFETPDPERPANNPTPGHEVDRMIYQMTELRQGVVENREHLEERLERLAVAIISNREDCSPVQARTILQEGTWTDDEAAAEFFQESGGSGEGAILAESVTDASATRDFVDSFEAAVEALIDIGDVDIAERESDDDDEDGGLLSGLLGGGGDEDDDTVETNWNVADSSAPSYATDEPFEDLTIRRTNRWLGVTGFGLVALGLGTLAFSPALMLAGAVGVSYAVYARLTAVPPTQGLVVERELEEDDPAPGEEVEVTVTVRNESGTMLPDLRMIDAVPDAFVVTDGTPRLMTALQADAEAEFTYTVRVERGEYRWPLLVLGRDFAGNVERASLVTPDVEMVCVPSLTIQNEVPVRAQTTQYAGEVDTKTGGAGLEFHSVREYRAGDPMNRINWKQVARTGELATIDFRQEKAANVTILFDTRQSAYVAPGAGEPHAVDQSVHAASDVFGALYDQGNLVGVAAFDTVPCWMAPGAGSEHREKARMLFAQHPALSPRPPERQEIDGGYIDPMTHVRRRLPSNSQVFLFTPLSDDFAAEVAQRLDSEGHLVTVISPDVTVDETIGQRLTRIERTVRVRYLRERGIRVIDWDTDTSLGLTIDEAQTRWAQ